jgi:hypothetical protein
MASIPSKTPVCATCTNWAGKRSVNLSAILQVDVNETGKCYLKGTTSTMVYRAFGGCMHMKSWDMWPPLGKITPTSPKEKSSQTTKPRQNSSSTSDDNFFGTTDIGDVSNAYKEMIGEYGKHYKNLKGFKNNPTKSVVSILEFTFSTIVFLFTLFPYLFKVLKIIGIVGFVGIAAYFLIPQIWWIFTSILAAIFR